MTSLRVIAAALFLVAMPAVAQEEMATLYKRAMELYRAGDFAGALPRFREALALAEERYGEDSPLLSLELNNLGEVYRSLGEYKSAEPLFKRAIALDEQTRETDDPGLATSLNNLALLYRSQERYAEAEPLYKRSLTLLERMLGPRHPDVAKSLNNLANLYRLEGRADDARPLLQRAIDVATTALGPEHPTTAVFERNLAELNAEDRGNDGRRSTVARAAEPDVVPSEVEPGAGAAGAAVPRMRPRTITASRKPAEPPAPSRAAAPGRTIAAAPSRVDATTPAGPGQFAVHVASTRAAGDVPGEWRHLTAIYPQLRRLGLQPPQAIVLPGKGVYYRVAGGPLPDRNAAQSLCAGLKSRGQFCAVIPR